MHFYSINMPSCNKYAEIFGKLMQKHYFCILNRNLTDMGQYILADNQDITRVGMMHVCDKFCEQTYRQVADKTELIEQLKQNGEAVVVLDYTLFDITKETYEEAVKQPPYLYVLALSKARKDILSEAHLSCENVLVRYSDINKVSKELRFMIKLDFRAQGVLALINKTTDIKRSFILV